MLKFFIGIAFGGLMMAGTAVAADVVNVPAFDWGGPYVGLDFGAAINSSTWNSPTNSYVPFQTNGTGFALGGVVGYRTQMKNLVLGVEGSADWLGVNGQANCLVATPTCVTKQDFLGSVQANIGFAADRFHIYGTGGIAFGDYQYSETTSLVQSWNGGMRTGWTAGIGADYAVSQKVVAGLRWNYYDFGTQASGGGVNPTVVNFAENGSLITARIEYKF